jgi:hypothetical protein
MSLRLSKTTATLLIFIVLAVLIGLPLVKIIPILSEESKNVQNIIPKIEQFIILQFQNLKEQKFLIDRKITYSEQDYFNQNKKIPLSNIPTADGLFIKKNYVPLLGKGNSDIMIGENEVILRSGKYDTSNVQKNKLNPSVFKILYQNKKSYNIQYADEFLLLSNKGDINFNKENLENNDQNEINKLVNQAHPVAFGDSMVDVLTLMRDLLLTHVHPYDGMKPISNEAYNKLSTFDFNKLFSKHIKIS